MTGPESPPKKRILRESASSNDGAGNRLDSPKTGPSVESPTQPLSMETTQQPSSKGKALKTGASKSTTIAKPQSKLPERKRGPGRTTKSSALSFYKCSAKPFQKKKKQIKLDVTNVFIMDNFFLMTNYLFLFSCLIKITAWGKCCKIHLLLLKRWLWHFRITFQRPC